MKPDYIWVFDLNRRVYERDENNRSRGGPIWREHWRKERVVGETSRSWVLATREKVPKNGANPRAFAFTERAIEMAAYVQDHRHRIADAVSRVDDCLILSAVAELIGYEVTWNRSPSSRR